jgi:hypothetical protein
MIACPKCHAPLAEELPIKPPKALSYVACFRKCTACEVGISNATKDPTHIYLHPTHNVPQESREGVDEALRGALNRAHREDKINKFAFSTSEDAVTWTIFSYLQRTRLLHQVISSLGLLPTHPKGEPTVLLWGSSLPNASELGRTLRGQIETTLRRLGESAASYSEPDVILDFGDEGLVIIEVKYQSANDFCSDRSKFDKYLLKSSGFRIPAHIVDSRLYELARNWRIGFELSNGRAMTLVNLVLRPRKQEYSSLELFCDGLSEDSRCRFRQIRWAQLLSQFEHPDWLASYIQTRGLMP